MFLRVRLVHSRLSFGRVVYERLIIDSKVDPRAGIKTQAWSKEIFEEYERKRNHE